jgi:hypothetical protein
LLTFLDVARRHPKRKKIKSQKAKARRAEEDERDDDAEDDDATMMRKKTTTMTPKMTAMTRTLPKNDDPDDDGDDDRKESKAVKNARIAERKRCARIFGSKHAAANPSLAASLAFNTGMSSAAAIDVLASTAPASQPATRKRSLDQRMQESHNVRLNRMAKKAGGKSALVSKMTSLYNSTKGEK